MKYNMIEGHQHSRK